jgi:peptidoglycan/LPS O-acetylase OafA/YrhL
MAETTHDAGGREMALESVRGLAALIVVLHHLVFGFAPHLFQRLDAPWLRIWHDGKFAVSVFFVLSGFVLSLSFVRTQQIETLRAAIVRRYWRLFIPVAASVIASYILMARGYYANREVARLLGQAETDWLSLWYGFPPSMGSAAREAAWGVFFSHSIEKTYNNVFWTLGTEFIGSLFVFAFLALSGGLRNRILIYGAVGFVLHRLGLTWFLAFLAGAGVCEMFHASRDVRAAHQSVVTITSVALILIGLTGAGLTQAWLAARTGLSLSDPVFKYIKPLSAVFLLAGVLGAPPVQRLLSLRPLVLLGWISFPLYLIHMQVECSLGCHVYLACLRRWSLSHEASVIWASTATLLVSFALAWVGALTVEPWSIRFGRWVYTTVFAPQAECRAAGASIPEFDLARPQNKAA